MPAMHTNPIDNAGWTFTPAYGNQRKVKHKHAKILFIGSTNIPSMC